jgi:hypothetical protein
MRRITWIALAAVIALIAVAAAGAIGNGSGAERVSATLAASSVGDPNLKTCAVTREDTYDKFTADYSGRLVTDREEVLGIIIDVKIIASVNTGLGTVKGTFSLMDVTTGATIGGGDLNAVGELSGFEDPNEFGGSVQGLMRGSIGDPNVRTIIWLFSASLSRGGRDLSGGIGDPTIMPASAILFPPDPCRL